MKLFIKNSEQDSKIGPVWELAPVGGGEDIRKACRRLNVLEVLHTHVCKWKNETY
jgi:hypothetical protein